jgi:hypothetical protein
MSPIGFESLSSSFIYGVTKYRNQPGNGNKCIAQAGYVLTTVIACVESAAAIVTCAGSSLAYPITSEPLDRSVKWLSSSGFCIIWSATDFCMNPKVHWLVADESSARQIAISRDLMRMPPGAVI